VFTGVEEAAGGAAAYQETGRNADTSCRLAHRRAAAATDLIAAAGAVYTGIFAGDFRN